MRSADADTTSLRPAHSPRRKWLRSGFGLKRKSQLHIAGWPCSDFRNRRSARDRSRYRRSRSSRIGPHSSDPRAFLRTRVGCCHTYSVSHHSDSLASHRIRCHTRRNQADRAPGSRSAPRALQSQRNTSTPPFPHIQAGNHRTNIGTPDKRPRVLEPHSRLHTRRNSECR